MPTIGQTFRQARERKEVTLSKAAAVTRIKVQLLEAMEDDDFSRMPAVAYAKGFIRMYSEFLGLDPVPLVEEYVRVHVEGEKEEEPPLRAEDSIAIDRASPIDWEEVGRKIAAGVTAFAGRFKGRHMIMKTGVILAIVAGVTTLSKCASQSGSDPNLALQMEAPSLLPGAMIKDPPEPYLQVSRDEP